MIFCIYIVISFYEASATIGITHTSIDLGESIAIAKGIVIHVHIYILGLIIRYYDGVSISNVFYIFHLFTISKIVWILGQVLLNWEPPAKLTTGHVMIQITLGIKMSARKHVAFVKDVK